MSLAYLSVCLKIGAARCHGKKGLITLGVLLFFIQTALKRLLDTRLFKLIEGPAIYVFI